MIKREQSLAELNQEAWQALVKELGVVKATRFLRQFDKGSGNYATDRDVWQEGLTVDDIVASIQRRKRQQRKPRARTNGRSTRIKSSKKR